jgi:hypothetical protein
LAVNYFGCVPAKQYKTALQTTEHHPGSTPTNTVLETSSDYTLGFVEFDDQGWLWNPQQVTTLTNRLYAEQDTNGLLIVVFVHGWMHDASPEDENVVMFRKKILRPLATMETFLSEKQHRPTRRVVGVYVGWRGLCQNVPLLNLLTFWDRKSAAERVGHGAVVELLCELEKLRNQGNGQHRGQIANHQRMSTKLLIIGHSFGGDVVYSAVAPILTERMIENVNAAGEAQAPKTMGDLVVLINPAFEAARFETVYRLGTTSQYPPGQHCTLAIFTSKSDMATKIAFPIARTVYTTFVQSHRDSEERAANQTAIGHYNPYISFDLAIHNKDRAKDEDIAKSGERVLALTEQLKNASSKSNEDRTYRFTHCQLEPRTNHVRNDPVFLVSVDPNIIPDHGSIDRGVFTRFLAEFLSLLSETDR